MKKNIKGVALALCLAVMMTGCASNNTSSKNESESTKININNSESGSDSESTTEITMGDFEASDYAKIGDYKKLTVSTSAVNVTADEIKTEVQSAITDATTEKEVKDRAVKNGDVVNIDYVGKVDGKEFKGGSAKASDLEIGSGSFIDGFEEGLIGAKIGKTLDIKVTFPDPYQNNTDLSGKDAVFTVTINSIKEKVVPKYDDKFVQSVSDHKTIKEYEKSIKEKLYNSKLESALSDALSGICTVDKYPDSLTAYCKNKATQYYTNVAAQYGYSYEEYITACGYTVESFEKELEPSIQLMAKEELAFRLVEKAEKLTSDKDKFAAWMEDSAKDNNITTDILKQNYTDEELNNYYLKSQVMDILKKTVTITEETEVETTTAPATEATTAAK